MARDEQLRKNLARLRRARETVESSIGRAAQMVAKSEGKRNVNVATRVNKAVATNVGEPGTVEGASSTQHVRITQNPGGTTEMSESTSVQESHRRT